MNFRSAWLSLLVAGITEEHLIKGLVIFKLSQPSLSLQS